jgi:hypothetical protein
MINSQLNLNVKANGVQEAKANFEALAGTIDKLSSCFEKLKTEIKPTLTTLRSLVKISGQIKPIDFGINGLSQTTSDVNKLIAALRGAKKASTDMKPPNLPSGGGGGGNTPGGVNPTETKSRFEALTSSFMASASAAKGVAMGVAGIGMAAAGAVASVLQLSQSMLDISSQGESLKALSSSFFMIGGSTRAIEELRAATGGAVSDIDLMKAANKAALFDIPKAEIPKLVKLAVGASAMMGSDLGQAIDDVFTGVGRKSMEIADNMGILISVGDANENLAKKLGKSVQALTQQEKTMAFAQEMVAKGTRQMEAAQISLRGEAGPAQAALANLWDDLKVSIYDAAKEAGLFTAIIKGAGEGENPLKYIAKGIMESLVPAIRVTLDLMPTFLDLMTDLLTKIEKAAKWAEDLKNKSGGEIAWDIGKMIGKGAVEGFVNYSGVALVAQAGVALSEYGILGSSSERVKAQEEEKKSVIDHGMALLEERKKFLDQLGVTTEVVGIFESLGINISPEESTAMISQYQADFQKAYLETKDFTKAYATANDGLLAGKGWNLTSAQVDRVSNSLKNLSVQIRSAESLKKVGFNFDAKEISAVDTELNRILEKQIKIAKQDEIATGQSVSKKEIIRRTAEEFAALGGDQARYNELFLLGNKRGIELMDESSKARIAQKNATIKAFYEERSILDEDYSIQKDFLWAKLELNGKTEKEITEALQQEYDRRIQLGKAFFGENTVGFERYLGKLNPMFNKLEGETAKKPGAKKQDTLTPLLQRAELMGKSEFRKKMIEIERQYLKDLKDAGKSEEGIRAANLIKAYGRYEALKKLATDEFTAIKSIADKGFAYIASMEGKVAEKKQLMDEASLINLRNSLKGRMVGFEDKAMTDMLGGRSLSPGEIEAQVEIEAEKMKWEEKRKTLAAGSEAYIAAYTAFADRLKQLEMDRRKEQIKAESEAAAAPIKAAFASFAGMYDQISSLQEDMVTNGTLAERNTANTIGGLLSMGQAMSGIHEEYARINAAAMEGTISQGQAAAQSGATFVASAAKGAAGFIKNEKAKYYLQGLGETAMAAKAVAALDFAGGIAHGAAAGLFFKAANRGGSGTASTKGPSAPRRSAAGSDRDRGTAGGRQTINQINIMLSPITGQAMVNTMNAEGNRREGSKITSRLISDGNRRSDM